MRRRRRIVKVEDSFGQVRLRANGEVLAVERKKPGGYGKWWYSRRLNDDRPAVHQPKTCSFCFDFFVFVFVLKSRQWCMRSSRRSAEARDIKQGRTEKEGHIHVSAMFFSAGWFKRQGEVAAWS